MSPLIRTFVLSVLSVYSSLGVAATCDVVASQNLVFPTYLVGQTSASAPSQSARLEVSCSLGTTELTHSFNVELNYGNNGSDSPPQRFMSNGTANLQYSITVPNQVMSCLVPIQTFAGRVWGPNVTGDGMVGVVSCGVSQLNPMATILVEDAEILANQAPTVGRYTDRIEVTIVP